MTDEVGCGVLLQPCGNAVRQSTQHSRGVMATRSCHLISRLAPTTSPRGEADGSAESSTFAGKSLPLAARRKATPSRKKLQRAPPPACPESTAAFLRKKARPTAKANEKGRWSGWKLAMKGKGKAQAAALFRRLSSALASSRAHTPLIRSGMTKGVTHQARLVARSLPDMNMNQAVPKV